jgi:flagellar operon protein
MANNTNINNILIPQVTKIPSKKDVNQSNKLEKGVPSEFKNLLDEKIGQSSQNQHGIQLSKHALKRLQERSLEMDSDEFFKIKNAMEQLKAKGGRDSLVITDNAAYILDINNNKIVTAIDKENMNENVFTKIDSTMILN